MPRAGILGLKAWRCRHDGVKIQMDMKTEPQNVPIFHATTYSPVRFR